MRFLRAPQAQAKQAFTNLSHLLEAAGTSMDNVVKTTVFIKEMNDFSAINEVYATFFNGAYPARSCVEVARLPKDVMLEVEGYCCKIKLLHKYFMRHKSYSLEKSRFS